MTLYEAPATILGDAKNWGGKELLEWQYDGKRM
jgi:hypothetical protein